MPDDLTDPRLASNRALWDEWTDVHVGSRYYDVDGFRAGGSSLLPLESAELGDVAGRSLLHLQCHFGMDTLSWARRGARVTGVDFSAKAVEAARSLAAEVGVPARFVESDVYALPEVLHEQFDIVFTSYGVLMWLPDLRRWAEVVAHFLRPGGTFYLAELHPVGRLLDDSYPPVFSRSYFLEDAREWVDPVSYADPDAAPGSGSAYLWLHRLGDVVTALLDAGLRLEYVHELPYCTFQRYEWLTQHDDGYWYGPEPLVPLIFSIRATRP